MKNYKAILAGVLAMLTLTACSAVPSNGVQTNAIGADTKLQTDCSAYAPAAMPEERTPYSIGVKAMVSEILDEDGVVSLEVVPEDSDPTILLVSDETIVVNNQTAAPASVADIKTGDIIFAYHDMTMTMSIPSKTPALAILTNLGESTPAVLHMPEQVQRADETVSGHREGVQNPAGSR